MTKQRLLWIVASLYRLGLAGAAVAAISTPAAAEGFCVGYKAAVGIERNLFVAGMKAAGFDLAISKCKPGFLGCAFKFNAGSGAVTAANDCVVAVLGFISGPDHRRTAAKFMIAAATAIRRGDIGDLATKFMMTATVADEGKFVLAPADLAIGADYEMRATDASVFVESRAKMTAQDLQRALDAMAGEAKAANEAEVRKLRKRLEHGR